LSAATSSSSMEISAYNDADSITTSFQLAVTRSSSSISTGDSFGITDTLTENDYSISAAFSITITTNSPGTANLAITFLPFISQSDSSSYVPISYTFTGGTDEVTVKSGGGKNKKYYHYTTSYSIDTTSPFTVSSTSGTTVTLSHIVEAEYSTSENGTYTSLTNTSSYTGNGGALKGIGSETLETSATFGLSISEDDYNNIASNTTYTATVRITVSGS